MTRASRIVDGLKVRTGRTPVAFETKEIAPKYERLCAALGKMAGIIETAP